MVGVSAQVWISFSLPFSLSLTPGCRSACTAASTMASVCSPRTYFGPFWQACDCPAQGGTPDRRQHLATLTPPTPGSGGYMTRDGRLNQSHSRQWPWPAAQRAALRRSLGTWTQYGAGRAPQTTNHKLQPPPPCPTARLSTGCTVTPCKGAYRMDHFPRFLHLKVGKKNK